MAELRWIDKLSRWALSLFSQREVKTPLSFYFRVVAAVTVILIVAMFQLEHELKYEAFLIIIAFFFILCLIVGAFAWFKPKHLVYGETGHRAETKFGMGTEKRQIEQAEISTLEGTENPNSRMIGNGKTV